MRVLVGVVDQEQLRARRRGRVWGDQRQGVWIVVQVNCVTLLWEGQRTKRGRGELKVTELAGTFLISRITYSRKYCKLPDWHQTFVCKLLEICLEFPVGHFLAYLH